MYGQCSHYNIFTHTLTIPVHTHNVIELTMATLITTEEMLQKNSSEYQQHLTTRNRVAKTLEYQNNIMAFQTIPKCFLPSTTPQAVIPNPTLSNEFQAEYQQLFFRHLSKVITHNTITLELENARLNELVTRTEKQLSTLTAPPETITQLRHKFYTENNIPNEETLPTTSQQVTQDETQTPSTSGSKCNSTKAHSKRPRKRNNQHQQNGRKMQKVQQHFLSRSCHTNPPA